MNDQHLIVFVKAPRPGAVKTRLGLGAESEAAAYQRLTRSVLGKLAEFAHVELRFAPADAEREISPWLRPGWHAKPQSEGDLGQRLANAFADAFRRAKRVVVIGSDCPYLEADDIRNAWTQLKTHDLVLGPAEDGGYWLIGLRQGPQPALFEDIAWSSSKVFSETMARAKALGLTSFLLRKLSDVDTREDWERFIAAEVQREKPHRLPTAD